MISFAVPYLTVSSARLCRCRWTGQESPPAPHRGIWDASPGFSFSPHPTPTPHAYRIPIQLAQRSQMKLFAQLWLPEPSASPGNMMSRRAPANLRISQQRPSLSEGPALECQSVGTNPVAPRFPSLEHFDGKRAPGVLRT
uniref:Uncharacterized protein n=1 Tax=Sphaerodactylus townsendi TaxID=933632 RepID=A0ACB8EDI7_9SAUR